MVKCQARRDPQSFSEYRIRSIQPAGVTLFVKLCGSFLDKTGFIKLSITLQAFRHGLNRVTDEQNNRKTDEVKG